MILCVSHHDSITCQDIEKSRKAFSPESAHHEDRPGIHFCTLHFGPSLLKYFPASCNQPVIQLCAATVFRDLLPYPSKGASCFDGYQRNLHRHAFPRSGGTLISMLSHWTLRKQARMEPHVIRPSSILSAGEYCNISREQKKGFTFNPSISEGGISRSISLKIINTNSLP